MELAYMTPEVLQDKRFMASRDPSFSDVRDYLTLPSTPILGTSDVRYLQTLRNYYSNQSICFLVRSCELFDFP